MKEEEQKMYIEVYIEGVLAVPESELQEVEGKISSVISHIFKKHKSVKLNFQISKYTEQDLFMSVQQASMGNDEFEN